MSGGGRALGKAALGLLLASGIAALLLFPLRGGFNSAELDRVREQVQAFGRAGPVVFALLGTVAITAGAPRSAFAALAGLWFGWLPGFACAQVGGLLACFVSFAAVRWFGRDLSLRVRGRVWRGALDHVERRPILATVLLRLGPVGNSVAVSSFLGLSGISAGEFLIGTLIGTVPGTLAYSLAGAGVASGSAAALALAPALLGAALAGGWLLIRFSFPRL